MRFDKEIFALTVDPHQPVRGAHDPFNTIDRSQSGPFEYADGVEYGIRIENPSAGLIALAAVKVTTPALVFRQTQGSQTLFLRMAVGMFRACRERRQVQARQVKQGVINFPWVVCTR